MRYRLSLDFTHTKRLDTFIVKEHLKRTQHKVREAERSVTADRRDAQTHRLSSVHNWIRLQRIISAHLSLAGH